MGELTLSHVSERSVLTGPGANRLQPYYIGMRRRHATCSGVAWFPGPYLAAVNLYGGHLRIYRFDPDGAAPRLELLHEVSEAIGYPENVAVAPDGKWLAIAKNVADRFLVTLYPIDPETLAPGRGTDIVERREPIHGLCFSPDARHLGFTGIGSPGYVETLRVGEPGEPCCHLENPHMPLRPKGIAFSPDGRFAALSIAQNATPEPAAKGCGGILSVHRYDGDCGTVTAEPVVQLRAAGPLEYAELCTFLARVAGRPYRILVANQGSDLVGAFDFDAADGSLASAGIFAKDLPFPHGIAASADGKWVAVTCYGDDTLKIVGTGPQPAAARPAPRRNRKVIFTAVTDGHDTLKPPAIVEPDIDYIAYTDAPEVAFPPPWQTVRVRQTGRNPRVTARWHKILPHRHLPDYDFSFWIDANYEIVRPFSARFDALAATTSLATHRHPQRDCIYDEAETVKAALLDRAAIVDRQVERYRAAGFPAHAGLVETGILFRSHHDARVKAMMEEWWGQIEMFSERDQLSANYVFWKHGFDYAELSLPSRSEHLLYHPHAKPPARFEPEVSTRLVDRLRRAAQHTGSGLIRQLAHRLVG